MDWIENLKVGDKVYKSHSGYIGCGIVIRFTKTCVVCGFRKKYPSDDYIEELYYIKSGNGRGNDMWRSEYLVEPTQDILDQCELQRLKNLATKYRDALTNLKLPKTKEDIITFINAFERFKPFLKDEL